MTYRPSRRPTRAAIPALLLGALALAPHALAQEYTYAIEIHGTLCGYADLKATTARDGDAKRLVVTENVLVMLTALGSEVTTRVDSTYHVDPTTGRFSYHESRIRQGDNDLELRAMVEGDTVRITDTLTRSEKTVPLPADTILDNPLFSPHLVRDVIERGVEKVTYPILAVREAEVQDTTYTRVGEERLELAGRQIDTVVVDQLNEVTGVEMRQWLDSTSGMVVKMDIPGGRSLYLADASVKTRIAVANLDASLIQKVDVAIADVQAIESMRVRAVLEPTGLRVRAEDLTVPGQRFEGTVDGNRIEGVFTISHPRYGGVGAPPFPPDFSDDAALAPFLVPEDLIESDDPVLVAHARAVTADANDSWDAAVRLSAWVADNISYAIPGGGSARRAFDSRAGECGAHSLLLAALCRSVGIPARVVWGCMYVPSHGGAFGQHAWNEIYMGDSGWVPVDSTAHENDFVDSGHVRVGIYQSLATAIHMREMEILEHRVAATEVDAESLAAFERYVGEYAHPAGKDPFVVLVQSSSLAVDIPGNVVLALRDADAHGRWYAKLTSRVYCTFPEDESGAVVALTIHETVQMPRRADPATVPDDAPDELRPYLGTYRLAAARADFEVLFDDGGFGVHDPIEDVVVHLKPTDVPGQWIDEFDKNRISFERDSDGDVTAMLLDVANRFARQRAPQDPAMSPEAAAVQAMLTDFHRAAAAADGKRWFGHFEPDAVCLGTDPSERWTIPELEAALAPHFAAGTGWTTVPTEQHVYLSSSGDVAWFDEALTSEKRGVMRGSGVALRRDGRWRIAHYNTVFPVPNELFGELMAEIAELPESAAPAAPPVEPTGPVAAIRDVLVGLNRAATERDRAAYFSAFAEDAIFLGTAPTERFTLEELKSYSEPYFAGVQGRERTSLAPRVSIVGSGDVAWFDDRLQYGDFGELRCSGVLVHRDGEWKLVQYHLAVPVPNDLVPDLVKRIRGDDR